MINPKLDTLPAQAGSRFNLDVWRENSKQAQNYKFKTQNASFEHLDFGFLVCLGFSV